VPDNQIALTFGGGLNGRRRVADVELDECVVPSENFDIDPQFRALMRRRAYDLVATAPNGGAIYGLAQVIKQDGSVSTIVQAAGEVYSWDGDTTFTSVGTVSTAARLRGPREHNFTLDEYVVVTDLKKTEVVKKWDGTSFVNLNHDLGGDLVAKYCRVHNERVFLANVKTTPASGISVDTPHVILSSFLGDGEVFTLANRPTSSLGLDAPFFLPTPDLRPINGLEAAFGTFVISTDRGRIYRLQGSTAFDYEIQEFHVGSAVVGDEAVKNIGNDVVMGLPGRIESLVGTLNFGDVEANDLSQAIAPQIEDVVGWTIEYDRRLQKVFCFPQDQSVIWVLHKKILTDQASQGLSPWSKWTTTHVMAFQPTTVMQLVDPVSKKDVVYMGDNLGNIYRLDGDLGQDGGTDDVTVKRRSRLFAVPEGNTFDIGGWVHYRKLFEGILTIRILGGGTAIYTQEIQLKLPENPDIGVYNGESYYSDNTSFYGVSFGGRIHSQDWKAAGQASNFQVEVEYTGSEEIDIEELQLTFKSSTT